MRVAYWRSSLWSLKTNHALMHRSSVPACSSDLGKGWSKARSHYCAATRCHYPTYNLPTQSAAKRVWPQCMFLELKGRQTTSAACTSIPQVLWRWVQATRFLIYEADKLILLLTFQFLSCLFRNVYVMADESYMYVNVLSLNMPWLLRAQTVAETIHPRETSQSESYK